MIFDTHAHYDDDRYQEDREAILASLPINGVGRVVNVAAGMDSVETTVQLAKRIEYMYAAIGVHPDEIGSLTEDDMKKLSLLVSEYGYRNATDFAHPNEHKIVAIGEIGLDYYWDTCDRALQKKWFERQLILAKEEGLPAIIHSRDAAQDSYEILKSTYTGDGACVVHCFSYPKEMARRFLDLGYYIGLGGVVTFKNGRVAKEVAQYVPEDRLLLETDAPYMAPTPYRGERNDSAKLDLVAAAIAELRGTTKEHIIDVTWENAHRFYRLKETV